MKKFRQIAAALIVAVLLLAALPISAAESGGMTFAADKVYRTVKPFAESPNTFEA